MGLHLRVVLLCATSTSCSFLGPPATLSTPEGLIHARSTEEAAACSEALRTLAPEVERTLGTRNDRVPRVHFRLGPPEDGLSGGANCREIVVFDVEFWRLVLAHELVHWNMIGYWETVPAALEEGMADLIGARVCGAKSARIPLLPPGTIDRALVVSERDLLRLKDEESARLRAAGTWVFASIGLEEMRRLAREARRLGLDSIPPEWIRPYLDE